MPPSRQLSAVWLVLASILSVQVGAAFAKGLFDQAPPLAVAWLRIAAAGVVLLAVARPWRALPRRDDSDATQRWRWVAAFTVSLIGMNVLFYLALARIPMGVAVTLEFLGPLGVALAGSRRILDLVWVGLAAVGVGVLGLSPGRLDPLGVLMALGAGALWAGYIIVGSHRNDNWRPLDALAIACLVGGVALAPIAWSSGPTTLFTPQVVLVGVLVGLLSTVLPYSLELTALQRLPAPTFGVLMSLEPAAAALAALIVLGERLRPADVLAVACVTLASAGATWNARRTATPISS